MNVYGAFPLGGPAPAGRAFVASDRAQGLAPAGFNPFRLRARRRCASLTLRTQRLRAQRACWGLDGLATALPSRGKGRGPLVRLMAHGWPRRGAGNRLSCRWLALGCPSEPPIAAQSLTGGGIRPALQACKVPRQVAGAAPYPRLWLR